MIIQSNEEKGGNRKGDYTIYPYDNVITLSTIKQYCKKNHAGQHSSCLKDKMRQFSLGNRHYSAMIEPQSPFNFISRCYTIECYNAYSLTPDIINNLFNGEVAYNNGVLGFQSQFATHIIDNLWNSECESASYSILPYDWNVITDYRGGGSYTYAFMPDIINILFNDAVTYRGVLD